MDLYDLLLKKIREMLNEGADHLALGGAKSFEDYHRVVGRIEGLSLVEREILDLIKSQEEDLLN